MRGRDGPGTGSGRLEGPGTGSERGASVLDGPGTGLGRTEGVRSAGGTEYWPTSDGSLTLSAASLVEESVGTYLPKVEGLVRMLDGSESDS